MITWKRPSTPFLLRLHGCLVIVWLLLFFPTALWLSKSILWVAFTNIYAIVIAHASAHHSLLTDKQKRRKLRLKRKHESARSTPTS